MNLQIPSPGFVYLSAPRDPDNRMGVKPLAAVVYRVRESLHNLYLVCPALIETAAFHAGVLSPQVDDLTDPLRLIPLASALYVLPHQNWRQDTSIWEEIFVAKRLGLPITFLQPMCPIPGLDPEILGEEELEVMRWGALSWR